MNIAANDISSLEEALRPFKALNDPERLLPACLGAVREHVATAAMLAALTIYQFEGVDPTAVLTVTDPTRKPLLARILPTKRVRIPSVDALNVALEIAIQQVVNPSLAKAVAAYVFVLLHGAQGENTREEIVAMGHMTAWMAFRYTKEVLSWRLAPGFES